MWNYVYPSYELYHHGILGMEHGKRMGPPYPLPASAHSVSEKKADWRKSLDDYTEIARKVSSSKKKDKSATNKKSTKTADTESEQVTENKSDNTSSEKVTKKSSSSKTSSGKGTSKSTLTSDNNINAITRGERLHSGQYRITGGKSGEIKLSEQEISRNHQAKVKRLLKKASKSTKSSNTVKGKAIADKLLN